MSCLLLVISIFPFLSAGFLLVPMLSLLHLTLQLQAYQPTWCHLLFLLQAILLPCSPPNLTLQPPAFLFYCLIKQLINTTLHVSVDCVCFKKCASESPDQICLCVQIKWPEPDSVLLSPPHRKLINTWSDRELDLSAELMAMLSIKWTLHINFMQHKK